MIISTSGNWQITFWRMINLKSPLTFFDLETTGTSISRDRIIEYAFIKVLPDGERVTRSGRLNPEMSIPEETSLIHGIYDNDVSEAPTFKQVARDLAKFLEGSDLSGFNILKFDVPMLVEEFLRADVPFDIEKRKLVDSQRIFHYMEKRNLHAALKFYCDEELTDAHSASADTEAALNVLEAQIQRYDGQTVTDNLGNEVGVISNDMSTLHNLTRSNLVDLAGRMVQRGEKVVFNFGKHRGKEVLKVLKDEPSYYDWVMNGDFPLDTKRRLTELKLKGFNR